MIQPFPTLPSSFFFDPARAARGVALVPLEAEQPAAGRREYSDADIALGLVEPAAPSWPTWLRDMSW